MINERIGRCRRNQRSRRTSSGVTAAVPGDNFTAPTSGLDDVIFTQGTTIDAARYADTVSKLAQHLGTQTWSQSTVTTKATIEMVQPVFVMPVRPARMYYVASAAGAVAGAHRVGTEDRFGVEGTTENVKVVNDLDWRLDLEEYMVAKKKHTRDLEAWTKNRARIYNLLVVKVSACGKFVLVDFFLKNRIYELNNLVSINSYKGI